MPTKAKFLPKGKLNYDLRLKQVLEEIALLKKRGITALSLNDPASGQSGKISFKSGKFICAATMHDRKVERKGYEALRFLCAIAVAEYSYDDTPQQASKEELNLMIDLNKVVQLCPTLPEDREELHNENAMLNRIFDPTATNTDGVPVVPNNLRISSDEDEDEDEDEDGNSDWKDSGYMVTGSHSVRKEQLETGGTQLPEPQKNSQSMVASPRRATAADIALEIIAFVTKVSNVSVKVLRGNFGTMIAVLAIAIICQLMLLLANGAFQQSANPNSDRSPSRSYSRRSAPAVRSAPVVKKVAPPATPSSIIEVDPKPRRRAYQTY